MLGRNVVDQLHHVDRLANSGTTKQPDLAAFGEGTYQIDHLDAGLQHFFRGGQLIVGRCGAVNGAALLFADRTFFVDGVTQNIHDATQGLGTDRH